MFCGIFSSIHIKNSNIIIKGLIWKRNFEINDREFFPRKNLQQKNNAFHKFYFYGSFFQEKDSLQLNRFQFSKINNLLPNSSILL